jgi:hypothetical protein
VCNGNPKTTFVQADFTKGLPLAEDERPYDLYFSSFGTSSHHTDDRTMVRLLSDIAKRTEDYSVVICDWLGRYSYEWRSLWTQDLKKNRVMDYVVSYIYDAEERMRRRDQLQHLDLRLICREEAESIVRRASIAAGVEIRPLVYFDRSVLVGRHMDTDEYNAYAQPLRYAVNSLHELNIRTDLSTLIVNYAPRPGFGFLNDYFENLQTCWNTLVQFTGDLLVKYDRQASRLTADVPAPPATYPQPLRETMARMRRVVEGVGWLTTGLPRENIIEPQLGYALRHLEMCLQAGQGLAHGLVGVFEISKK